MGIDLKEQEYWNSVDRQVVDDSGYLTDNFDKRRAMLEQLYKFSFVGQRVLEIGVGNGLTAHMVRSVNIPMKYAGIDVSDKFAATAKKMFHLDVKVADAAELPFPDNSFDSIWCFDSLEHIAPHKREQMYKEFDRVLKKEARYFFINNPLDEHTSGHDKDFDFGFEEKDLGRLCEVTGTRIYSVTTIESQVRQYQFIVLSKLV